MQFSHPSSRTSLAGLPGTSVMLSPPHPGAHSHFRSRAFSRRNFIAGVWQKLQQTVARALWLVVVLAAVTALLPAQDVTIKEYIVPTPNSGPNGITLGPDGAVWFTESSSIGGLSKIGRITETGDVTEYSLATCCAPEQITTGSDGALWFTKSYSNQVARITTAGMITEYLVPSAGSYPVGIASGPDGALWFTELLGNRVGRITTSGVITEYSLPFANSGPNFISVGPDGAMWFTESFGNRIGRITTAGAITEYPMNAGGYPIGITSGPDGRVWFVDYIGNSIGAITTTGGVITEYPVNPPQPPGALNLAGITAGPDGALWFTELDANKVGRITTSGGITEYLVPTQNSLPSGITSGPGDALWFTEGGADQIGEVVLKLTDITPPVITARADPRRLSPPDGRMITVTVSGTITDLGSGVQASSAEYAVTDEYRLVQPRGHVMLDPAGSYLFTVPLQASLQSVDPDARHYWIRVSARDNAGNRGVKWSVVEVPQQSR